jgi:hypothetical protein
VVVTFSSLRLPWRSGFFARTIIGSAQGGIVARKSLRPIGSDAVACDSVGSTLASFVFMSESLQPPTVGVDISRAGNTLTPYGAAA